MKHRAIVVLFVLVSAATVSAQVASTAAQTPGTKKTDILQGFSVVLVLGDLQNTPSNDTLPPAAREALNDMKDFLPYKSYRLLDTAWILGPNSGPSMSRVRGPDERDYDVILNAGVFATGVQIKFLLRESRVPNPDASELRQRQITQELAAVQALRQALEQEALAARKGSGAKTAEPVQLREKADELRRRAVELEAQSRAASGGAIVIDTGFKMDIGETVVVGTSRLRGEKALIAILTAVPRTR
jgi:hypothetical protein